MLDLPLDDVSATKLREALAESDEAALQAGIPESEVLSVIRTVVCTGGPIPELPEVEHAGRFWAVLWWELGRIAKVRVGPDTIVCAPKIVRRRSPRRSAASWKFLIVVESSCGCHLVDRPAILVHLGMTKVPFGCGEQGLQLLALAQFEEQWPPRFEKFWLKLENEVEVAFTDPRRFGRLRLLVPCTNLLFQILKTDPIVDEIDLSAVSDAAAVASPSAPSKVCCWTRNLWLGLAAGLQTKRATKPN